MKTNLTQPQKEILQEFYSGEPRKVKISKKEREEIWKDFKSNRNIKKYIELKEKVPAIYAEMEKSLESGRKIQPGVFSECVYSQAIAEKLNLVNFENHINLKLNSSKYPVEIQDKLNHLKVRYSYTRINDGLALLQAGGAKEVDCALISVKNGNVSMIELKEPYARTSAPDLPRYSEDGLLISSEKFEKKYPQFRSMVEELLSQNFSIFEHVGNNYSNFKPENIFTAVSENYSGEKFADFISTEDVDGNLVLIPSSDITKWSKLEGELRPTGRNSYKVWTPNKLEKTLNEKNAEIVSDKVTLKMQDLEERIERGGERVSGWKISPMFWVRVEDVTVNEKYVSFSLKSVRQNIADITAKINLKSISYSEIEKYYLDII